MSRPSESVLNVARSWLGLSVPPVGKPRRRPHHKTVAKRQPRLIARLERAGCHPRQVGPDEWVALCPRCQLAGRHAVLEIRRAADGVLIVCCQEAHEERRAA